MRLTNDSAMTTPAFRTKQTPLLQHSVTAWQVGLKSGLALCLAYILIASSSFSRADDTVTSTDRVLEIFSNYCYDCHSGSEPEGGVSVDFFEANEPLDKRVDVVEKIIRVLKEQEMPPADYDQPTSVDRVAAIDWVETQLKNFDCGSVSRPGRVTMRRLNRVEYDNTIRDLTGLDLGLAKDFPSDDVGNGFDNIGDVLTIPPILLEKYLSAAAEVAAKVMADPEATKRVFPFEVENEEDLEQVVEVSKRNAEHFMERAFRRPVKSKESNRMFELMRSAFMEKGLGPEKIRETIIMATLSSPHFVYKVEADEPSDFVDGIRPLNDYEIATRLSYFLWSSMPDERLFQLAEAGKLRTAEQIEAAVDWMLDDPKAVALTNNFAGQWLQLRDLQNLSPDPDLFPEFDDDLRAAMRKETELLFASLIQDNRSCLDLLDAEYSYLNGRLADFYGVEGVDGEEFRRVDMSGRRSGVLMHASVLLITSNPTRTSPVKRGKWVLDNLLDEPPPPPPPNVPELGESGETLGTLRQQMEQHRANPNCAVCHTKMDALGFGLENFDAIGKLRETDGKDRIDPSGKLPGGREFDGPVDLVRILAEDKKMEFTRCLARRLLTYSLGRGLGVYDRCTVNTIVDQVRGDQFRFRTLIKAVATSEPFMTQESASSSR
jgi:mono/diheme cytochrome c family protein